MNRAKEGNSYSHKEIDTPNLQLINVGVVFKADATRINARNQNLEVETQEGILERYSTDHYIVITTEYKDQPHHIELKALITIDLLKKKLIRYFNGLDTLRDYRLHDETDKAILKERTIKRAKKTICKYLKQLRQDANFNIKRLESGIALNYLGEYASCKRVVVL